MSAGLDLADALVTLLLGVSGVVAIVGLGIALLRQAGG